MGVKHPVPHKNIEHKTNHADGWRHPVKNPTTNYAPDKHKIFCERCFKSRGYCYDTGDQRKSFACNI